jgi:choline dehydrogenase-like flavoprotein
LGVDIDRWLAKAKTPWDAHPNSDDGKMDAETAALSQALATRQCAAADRLARDQAGGRTPMGGSPASPIGRMVRRTLRPKLVILSAGAVQSAVLLLRSANGNFPTWAGQFAPIRSAGIS